MTPTFADTVFPRLREGVAVYRKDGKITIVREVNDLGFEALSLDGDTNNSVRLDQWMYDKDGYFVGKEYLSDFPYHIVGVVVQPHAKVPPSDSEELQYNDPCEVRDSKDRGWYSEPNMRYIGLNPAHTSPDARRHIVVDNNGRASTWVYARRREPACASWTICKQYNGSDHFVIVISPNAVISTRNLDEVCDRLRAVVDNINLEAKVINGQETT